MTQKLVDSFVAILSIVLCVQNGDSTVDVDISQIQGKPIGVGLPQFKPDEIDGLPTAELLFTKYVRPSKPLIMRGAAKVSPAFHKWSDEYFLSLDIPKGMTVAVEQRKKEDRKAGMQSMSFHQFLKVYNSSDIYMVQDVPSYLKGDLVIPCPLRCEEMKFATTVMWFSSGGTSSVLHTDSVDNFNCLFRGRKNILFIDRKHGQHHSLDHLEGSYSGVDVDAVDYEKYPGLGKVEYYNASMSAGDCVYIPYLWAHQVRSYGSNLAVNLWWNNEVNERIEPSKCAGNCDLPINYNEVTFGDKTQISYTDVRDKIISIMKSATSMSIPNITSTMLTDPALSEYFSSEDAPLLEKRVNNALEPIDANRDDILTVDEIMEATDTSWSEMVKFANELSDGEGGDNDDEDEPEDEDSEEPPTEEPEGATKDEL